MYAKQIKVALKDYYVLVNLELISFQTKRENVDAWQKRTRNSFERKVKRDFYSQIKVKQEVSLEYAINFYASGRTLINTKNHRKKLLEKRVAVLKRVYGIIFQIKGSKINCKASGLELTNQIETPGCSNFDVIDMDMNQNQFSNKHDLMLTIKKKNRS